MFFPASRFSERKNVEEAIELGEINSRHFGLRALNLSHNGLTESFLDGFSPGTSDTPLVRTSLLANLIVDYFSHLKLLKLSYNQIRSLNRHHFQLFNCLLKSKLEALIVDHNDLSSIRHDTFYDLKYLKYLDLSNNRLKLIHPLTFSHLNELHVMSVANNQLKALFKTPVLDNQEENLNETSLLNSSLPSLKRLHLQGNKDIQCDFGLKWLFNLRNKLEFDDFSCKLVSCSNQSSTGCNPVKFDSLKDEDFLINASKTPNLIVDTQILDQTSDISIFRRWSKLWFAHNFLVDQVPVTTPYPYLRSKDEDQSLDDQLDKPEKRNYLSWRMSDAIFDCSNRDENGQDDSESTIIWKTQFGYLSYLDKELMDSIYKEQTDDQVYNDQNETISNRNSFKIFYKMNKLTKISNKFTVKVGVKYSGQTLSQFYVNSKNQLIVTNMRQMVTGSFVCISLNERGIKTYEYEMHLRAGVSEYFIYCLFVSLICSIIPSIIGLIICCVCEYQAEKNYPMTPPCYPTPMASTPPNFDFNEWMANAASYLPNINIQETLDQVSKKLRKGMEKASVTVKSLGLTSTAYIYSMYEHSTQRWSDIKSYVPTLNVPTITLPTMKYPPMGQIANKMRNGVGSMFIQLREFCGTSDLTHTASIVDIESDTNASNAVGKTYIMDQFDLRHGESSISANQHFHNYYKFLSYIKEQSDKKQRAKEANKRLNEECEDEHLARSSASLGAVDENMPTTSSYRAPTEQRDFHVPRLNLMVAVVHQNEQEESECDEESSEEFKQTVNKDPVA